MTSGTIDARRCDVDKCDALGVQVMYLFFLLCSATSVWCYYQD